MASRGSPGTWTSPAVSRARRPDCWWASARRRRSRSRCSAARVLVLPGLGIHTTLDGAGTGSIPFLVPTDSRLRGLNVNFQAVILDAGAPGRLSMTNGLGCKSRECSRGARNPAWPASSPRPSNSPRPSGSGSPRQQHRRRPPSGRRGSDDSTLWVAAAGCDGDVDPLTEVERLEREGTLTRIFCARVPGNGSALLVGLPIASR